MSNICLLKGVIFGFLVMNTNRGHHALLCKIVMFCTSLVMVFILFS